MTNMPSLENHTDLQSLVEVLHHGDPLACLLSKLSSLNLQCFHLVVQLFLVYIGLCHPKVGGKGSVRDWSKQRRNRRDFSSLSTSPPIFPVQPFTALNGFPAHDRLTPGQRQMLGDYNWVSSQAVVAEPLNPHLEIIIQDWKHLDRIRLEEKAGKRLSTVWQLWEGGVMQRKADLSAQKSNRQKCLNLFYSEIKYLYSVRLRLQS